MYFTGLSNVYSTRDGRQPRKRAGPGVVTYDKTRRRATRQRREGHMERHGRGGGRKRVLPSGTLVIERVVRGRYVWHDSLLPAKRRRE